MKNGKTILAFAALVAAVAPLGCHSQVPPSPNPSVNLTWTAPAGCTSSAACTYVISRATVPSGTTACPATTGTTYTPLNQSSPTTGTTYTDSSPTALVCYTAQTVQNNLTSVASAASNSGAPLAVPVVPLAPGAPSATATADLVKPELNPRPLEQLARNDSLAAPIMVRATIRR
jgi:hypothetical protein